MSKLSRFTLTSGERYLILFEKSTFYSGINDILDLSNNEILAINEFSNRCKKILKADLLEIKLFGSKAKGTGDPESDIDILIITKEINIKQKDLIFEIAADINLNYDILIVPITIEGKIYYSPLSQVTNFYKSTQEEGIVL